MSATVGLELGPDLLRAVRLERWGRSDGRSVVQPWDPRDPTEGIAGIGRQLGSVGRWAVAVDLSFLYAKQVRLPPLPTPEKRRILTLEPERFFPVRGEELVLALRAEDNLVFAMPATMLDRWLIALEGIAPVELVEPAPVSLARALGRALSDRATILRQEHPHGVGLIEVEAGRLRSVHRLADDPEALEALLASGPADVGRLYLASLDGDRSEPLPAVAGLDRAEALPEVDRIVPSHLVAYGVALGLGGSLDEALLPTDLARRITRRRRGSLALGATVCLLATIFALAALDGRRARTLDGIGEEIARVRARADRVLEVQQAGAALDGELRAVGAIAGGRADPAATLAALTRELPPGAHILALRSSGNEWQIDGYAREAAPLVATLEEAPQFAGVHFLSATSRTRVDGSVYESFSIAFRVVSKP